jgi:hypothetical protein
VTAITFLSASLTPVWPPEEASTKRASAGRTNVGSARVLGVAGAFSPRHLRQASFGENVVRQARH